MNRRSFLQVAVAGMAATALSSSLALGAPVKFARGLRSVPDRGMARRPLRLVAGKMPEGFSGTYYLNGPAKFERGNTQYDHWFDGDGKINAFRFGDEGATHEARFVETPKFKAEQKAGRFLYPGFDTFPPDPAPATKSDDINAANISVLPVGDQLWALWEGGSPTAVKRSDLSTEGLVTLGEGLEGVPFSAHPRVDPQGRIWGFGNSAFTSQLLLYELGPDGSLKRAKVLDDVPPSMVHDFTATEKHLIVGFAPFLIAGYEGTYLDRFTWHADKPRFYYVIDKESFEVTRRYELPAAFVFHHFNAWEEADGTIRFASCAYEDGGFMTEEARDMMKGEPFSGKNEAEFEAITLYPDGTHKVERDGIKAEFPVCDPRMAGHRTESFHIGHGSGGNSFSNAYISRGPDGAITGRWEAEADTHLGEHVAIPRPDGKVWLIGTQFDSMRGRTLVSLFDGGNVSAGPMALWETPEVIPLPLHGAWVPA